jgi:hypothetical protein
LTNSLASLMTFGEAAMTVRQIGRNVNWLYPRGRDAQRSSCVGWSGDCSGAGACQIVLSAATSVTATFDQNRPALTTAPASDVTRHTASLTATVDPEGDASSCRFEYGPTNAYDAEVSCLTHPGSGASPVPVSVELWDLAPGTVYHYRLVSANTGGVTYGPDETFTTLAESCADDAALCLPQPPSIVGQRAEEGPLLSNHMTTTTLTNAQKLANTLKACKRHKKKSVRVNCEKRARKRYLPTKKKAKKSARNCRLCRESNTSSTSVVQP